MPLLPEGFALPPLPYLVALVAAVVLVAGGVYARRPTVTARHVLGLAPWMAVGSALHVLYVVGALPAGLRPFAGTPAVYLTVAAVAGGLWLAADAVAATRDRVPSTLAIAGVLALAPVVAGVLWVGVDRGTLSPVWPAVALVASVPVTWGAWVALVRLYPRSSVAGWVGVLTVFGHALDGVSTAVGIDLLGFGERTPLSRWIMEIASTLPTGDLIGAGWLFVLVKLALAGGIVALFAETIEEDPTAGYLLLGFVAAVGLGPGTHNLLLFTVAG